MTRISWIRPGSIFGRPVGIRFPQVAAKCLRLFGLQPGGAPDRGPPFGRDDPEGDFRRLGAGVLDGGLDALGGGQVPPSGGRRNGNPGDPSSRLRRFSQGHVQFGHLQFQHPALPRVVELSRQAADLDQFRGRERCAQSSVCADASPSSAWATPVQKRTARNVETIRLMVVISCPVPGRDSFALPDRFGWLASLSIGSGSLFEIFRGIPRPRLVQPRHLGGTFRTQTVRHLGCFG